MTTSSIHPETALGHVHLIVSNLERSLGFYQNNIGLQVHRHEGKTAYLGAGGADLLALTEQPDARPKQRTTGLYHFAILVPSRFELAQSLKRIAETQTPVEGFADHLVSEAIYLPDPDGNGIEIYRDRPREQWQYANGQLKMATDPLDIEGVMGELAGHDQPWKGLHPNTIIGHVHLHVADIAQAEIFYRDVLGFDLILRYGGAASFLSAGGYHHHIGVNTWAGQSHPHPDSVGLRWFVIRLPDVESLNNAVTHIQQANVEVNEQDKGWLLHDPVGNGIILTGQ